MTHKQLLEVLVNKITNMNKFDVVILKDIIAGLALKGDSIQDFYREITTCGKFLDLALIQNIAKKYSVPSLYSDHIDSRFGLFKENIKVVCSQNPQFSMENKRPVLNPGGWLRDKKPMFGSTEKATIEKAGGLEKICSQILNVGYFDYLRTLFEESATDVSKVKYALMIKDVTNQIGGHK